MPALKSLKLQVTHRYCSHSHWSEVVTGPQPNCKGLWET